MKESKKTFFHACEGVSLCNSLMPYVQTLTTIGCHEVIWGGLVGVHAIF